MAVRWKRPSNSKTTKALAFVTSAAIAVGGVVLLGPGLARVERMDARAPADPAALPVELAGESFFDSADVPGFDEIWSPAAEEPPEIDPLATTDCIIEPSAVVEIRSPVRGRIERLLVERGQKVEKGQILVELESGVEIASVDAARARAELTGAIDSRAARLELVQSKQTRATSLFDENALSADQREEVETEAKVARLELQQAREDREMARLELRRAIAVVARRTIRSPISGFVVERQMSVGEVVDEDTMLSVAQIDPVRVEVFLPSSMYGMIKIGSHAEVQPELPNAAPRTAIVEVVDPLIDPASDTFGVRLGLPNPDHTIPGGLRCRLRFLIK